VVLHDKKTNWPIFHKNPCKSSGSGVENGWVIFASQLNEKWLIASGLGRLLGKRRKDRNLI
jgi:hypothetical protein